MSMTSQSASPASVKTEIPSEVPVTGPIALAGAPRPAGAPKPKPRKRVNTAEKRHQHNAIERQRRETLNSKFLVLARLLPSLAACRRPSKSAIVNGSISHLGRQRDQRLLASKLLRQLTAERDALFAEVNEWRTASGFQPRDGVTSAWTAEMDEVVSVEKETFGNFASVGGEGGNGDDEDDDMATDMNQEAMNLEQAALVAGTFGSGLVTPRSSSDIAAGVLATQPIFKSAPVQVQHPIGWASGNDYSLGANSSSSLPYGTFMTESVSVEQSPSSASPLGSQHGAIVTPPSTDMAGIYTHTPSPRSTMSAEERPSAPVVAAQVAASSRHHSMPAQWNTQQMAFFQQQIQQHNLQRQQQQAALAAFAAQQQQHSDMGAGAGVFGSMFLGHNAAVAAAASSFVPQQHQQDGFAQIMASMFPQQRDSSAASSEQIEQWRKIALGGLLSQGQTDSQPSLNDIKNAVRTGMGLGFGMANGWNEQAVEGF